MTVILDVPPQPPVVPIVRDADAFGVEGEFVSKAAEEAVRHLEDLAEWLLRETPLAEEEFEYEPVPLKQVGTLTVHCNFVGPLISMPYEWDD